MLKHFRQYLKQLGISNCTCNFLKAFLLCKFVTNFFINPERGNGCEWFIFINEIPF